MGKMLPSTALVLKATLHLVLLAISLGCAKSARILTELPDILPPVAPPESEAANIVVTPVPNVAPETSLLAPKSATVAKPLTFFMHDILGGSAPSERVVAGLTTITQIKGLPFAKRNIGVFPLNGGIPLTISNNGGNINTKNIGIINNNNNNNLPFVTGLNGAITSTNTLPFVTAGQLPQGATLQQPMFGTITVIDDELTEGKEFGSSVKGKVQGFYLASSLDGSSHSMAFTALFGDHEEDCISFFGVHRTAVHKSPIAVVGGTGKYANAAGYATIETLQLTDQHTTDGVDTVLQFMVYLSKK